MKIAILLQVLAVLSRYQIVNAIFGFGVAKKPIYLPPQSYYSKSVDQIFYGKPVLTIEDLKIKSEPEENYFGGYFAGNGQTGLESALLQQQAKQQSPVAYGKLLKPIVLFPNGWIQGAHIEGTDDIKPVTEDQPDDIKFDFRTRTHSLR